MGTNSEFCEVKTGVTGTKLAKLKCTPSTAAGAGAVAPTGGCLCGSDDVAVSAGAWCGIKTDGSGLSMATATCPTAKTNGLTSPTAACNCGTNAAVPITTSEFCEVKTGVVGGKLAKVKSPSGGCLCGSDDVDLAANKWCGIKAAGTGVQLDNAACPTASQNGQASPSAACNCGTEANTAVTTSQFCYVSAGVTTCAMQTTKQCAGFAANQADGTTVAAQACTCAITAATTCNFCLESANAVSNAAWEACAVTDGSAGNLKGPNKCKCDTAGCATGQFCYTAASYGSKCRSAALTSCSNTVGTVAVDDDCLCGTAKAN